MLHLSPFGTDGADALTRFLVHLATGCHLCLDQETESQLVSSSGWLEETLMIVELAVYQHLTLKQMDAQPCDM